MDTPKNLTALADQLRGHGIPAELVLAVTEPKSGNKITIRCRRDHDGQLEFIVERAPITEVEQLIRALTAVTGHLKTA